MTKPTRRSWALAALVMTSASITAIAQPATPTIRAATFYTVKPDRVGDFLAATKEYAAVVRANGGKNYSVWMSATGEREYAVVTYHAKWAELDVTQDPKLKDVATSLSAIARRIMSCVESSRRVIHSLEADLSLPMTTDPPPSMVRVLRTWVRPDKVNEYRALIKNEVLPAARKSGIKVYSVSNARFGGSAMEFNTVLGLDKWADLDGEGPIVTAMGGREAYSRFLVKLRPLIARSEAEVYRLQKDQSYLP